MSELGQVNTDCIVKLAGSEGCGSASVADIISPMHPPASVVAGVSTRHKCLCSHVLARYYNILTCSQIPRDPVTVGPNAL